MTTLHVTVGDRERLRENALEFVSDVEAGDLDPDREDRVDLQFGSYDDLVTHLTPLRLDLIRTVAEHEPESMRAVARIVDRDVADVHSDLKQLEVLNILTLEEGGPGGAMQPVIPFDRIEVHLDFLLDHDIDLDSASASAD